MPKKLLRKTRVQFCSRALKVYELCLKKGEGLGMPPKSTSGNENGRGRGGEVGGVESLGFLPIFVLMMGNR